MRTRYTVSILLSPVFIFGYVMATPNSDATTNAATQELSEKIFSIEKMTCKMCHIMVRKAIEKVVGVVKVTVDYDQKTATGLFNPYKATNEEIALASTNIGPTETVRSVRGVSRKQVAWLNLKRTTEARL